MIPYDHNAPMNLWFLAWRQNIRNAKANPTQITGYCEAAAIAYTQHLCYMAQEVAKERSKYDRQ